MRYLIAQHVADPFRREPRNVGVVIGDGSALRARFVGESNPGQYDGRKLRGFAYPDVYKQWVTYWRAVLSNEREPLEALLRGGAAHFQVIEGGDLSSETAAPLDDALNYLYALLVSEGGFAEAVGGVADSDAEATLREIVSDDFQQANILAHGGEGVPLVRYPVERNRAVVGKAGIEHRPAFVQANGVSAIMETVDFTIRNKESGKDHAGLTCYMFDDLRKAASGRPPRAFALVRVGPEDEDSAAVQYGLSILKRESDEVVNWLDGDARAAFVESRRLVALGEVEA